MARRRAIAAGVIGLGRMGSRHALSLAASPDAELVALCDPDPSAQEKGHTIAPRMTATVDEMLSAGLDAVVIASPSQLHARHVKQCAEAGVAIYVEKPIALTPEDAEVALGAVARHGVPFQIGFQRRWDLRYQAVRAAIEAGEVGDPVLVKCHGRDPAPSLHRGSNGGIFVNCAIHDYDTVAFLTGATVASVGATAATVVHAELSTVGDADLCTTTLWLDNGAMAITEWSRFASHGYDINVEVVGTTGSITLVPGAQSRSEIHIQRSQVVVSQMLDVFGPAFDASVGAFAAAVREGRMPEPGAEAARHALQVAITARASSEVDGQRLDVPEPPVAPARSHLDG